MKIIRQFIALSILVSLVQNILFLYIEKVYISGNLTYKEVKVDVKQESKSVKVAVPKNAKDIKISDDGKFMAYFEGALLKVVNLSTGTVNEVIPTENTNTNFYKWIPDDLLIVVDKTNATAKNKMFNIISYDAKKNEKKQIVDHNNNITKITITNEIQQIKDMVFSTSTHTMYFKVSKTNSKSDLYTVNVMNQIERVKSDSTIGNINLLPRNTNLIYEDESTGKIKILNKTQGIDIKNAKKLSLLGSDKDEKIYLGEIINDKVAKIYYGTVDVKTDNWTIKALKEPVSQKEIAIGSSGDIIINDILKGNLNFLESNNTINYNGRFTGIFNGGLISIKDNYIEKVFFK